MAPMVEAGDRKPARNSASFQAAISNVHLRRTEGKFAIGRTARSRMAAVGTATRTSLNAVDPGLERARRHANPRLFSNHFHRLAALRNGKRRFGGDCCGR